MWDIDDKKHLERITLALEKISKFVDKFNETSIKIKPSTSNDDNMLFKNNYNTKSKSNKEKNHTDAWVLQPYNVCITTYPPKYLTTIFHYHDKDGIFEPGLSRGPNTKVFFTKDEAITYCKISLGSEYEIVDIPMSQKVVIGDDYE